MSKIIKIFAIFAVFFVLLAVSAVIFLPKSLVFFENEMILASERSGFLMSIENTAFVFPDKIVFENAEVSSLANRDFSAKISHFALDFSITDYIKSLFKRNRTVFDFSDVVELSDISLFFKENEILSNAKARINFTPDGLNYKIFTDGFNYGDFEISDIEIDGFLDSISTNFTIKTEVFGGIANVFADYDLLKNKFSINRITLQNIDLPKILQNDINIAGRLSGEIIPQELPRNFSNLDEILKYTKAECVLSIRNFRLKDMNFSRPITDAVQFVGINSLDFQEITARINYSYENTRVSQIIADNFKYAFHLSGTFIPKTQRIDFYTEIIFNPDMKFAIQRNIWNSMLPAGTNGQGRKLTGRISGSGSNVSVSLDGEIMRRGVNSLLSDLRNLF